MKKQNNHGSNLLSYTVGFLLSIVVTFVAYIIAKEGIFAGWIGIYIILGLAIIQLIIQAFFFLHITEEKRPRFNLLTFCFMIMIIFILVAGSIWIMHNLDYNMMPKQQEQYMLDQYNKGGF